VRGWGAVLRGGACGVGLTCAAMVTTIATIITVTSHRDAETQRYFDFL
jgi:hypothetical protein